MDSVKRIQVRDALYTVASRAPTANDDRRSGTILIGSRWIFGNAEYRCDSDLFEHAVWTLVGGGSSAPTRADVIAVLYVENASAPTINDDVGDGYVVGTRWLTPTDEYVCLDDTAADAVWKCTTTSSVTVTADDVSATAHAQLTGTTVQSQLTSIADQLAALSVVVYLFMRIDGHNSVLDGFDGSAIISVTSSVLS